MVALRVEVDRGKQIMLSDFGPVRLTKTVHVEQVKWLDLVSKPRLQQAMTLLSVRLSSHKLKCLYIMFSTIFSLWRWGAARHVSVLVAPTRA